MVEEQGLELTVLGPSRLSANDAPVWTSFPVPSKTARCSLSPHTDCVGFPRCEDLGRAQMWLALGPDLSVGVCCPYFFLFFKSAKHGETPVDLRPSGLESRGHKGTTDSTLFTSCMEALI